MYAPPAPEVLAKVLGDVTWTLYADCPDIYVHGRLVGTDICARRTVGVPNFNMVRAAMERIEEVLRAKAVEKGLGKIAETRIVKPVLEGEIDKQLPWVQ